MAASPIAIIRENARREQTGDANFVKKLLYFFELRVPERLGARVQAVNGRFFFPLVIGPDSYSMEEPFTLAATPTQGGGLYIEENGIVQRMIRLHGNTGFQPRKLPGDSAVTAANLPTVKTSHSRRLQPTVLAAISGQRHFQYLQDTVFRMYADLKRDPETSEGTYLLFHNPRDDEHWLVAPQKFSLERTAEKRILYEYTIELLVVDKGEEPDADFSEDKKWLDVVKDKLAMVKSFANMATGAVRDLTATLNEIGSIVDSAVAILGTIGELVSAAEDFLEGVTDLIEAPAALLTTLADDLETLNSALVNTVSNVKNIPSTYLNSWRQLETAVHRLGLFPENFQTDAQKRLGNIRSRQRISSSTLSAASAASAPGTVDAFGQLGTSPLPGAVNRAEADLRAGEEINKWTAAREITVSVGDTLSSLAARYLGDARLWQDIAILNDMKPPFIEALAGADLGGPDSPIPGVVGSGQALLVPTFGVPPSAQPVLPVLGVKADDDFPAQVLGRDYALQATTDRQDRFDWVIDVEHGSTDFKKVGGIPNLQQGLVTRMTTIKGENILYKKLGVERIIGLSQADVDVELARFRIVETLNADPRISGIQRLSFNAEEGTTPDALVVDADLQVTGFAQGVNVKALV